MFSPTVQLRSGGYIVINQTEALVAIDVNSGRATREHHIEDTALKTNLEAAEEVARQLRLRDLAGLIVIDFIDMDESRNNRAVERRLKEALKNDRARIQVGRISHFGLMEMSRQRIRSSVLESSTDKCPHCGGTGHVRSVSSVALHLLRVLEEMLLKGATHNLIVRTRSDVALYVLNHKRAHLRELEERFQITITVNADATIGAAQPFLIEKGEQVHSIEAAQGDWRRRCRPPLLPSTRRRGRCRRRRRRSTRPRRRAEAEAEGPTEQPAEGEARDGEPRRRDGNGAAPARGRGRGRGRRQASRAKAAVRRTRPSPSTPMRARGRRRRGAPRQAAADRRPRRGHAAARRAMATATPPPPARPARRTAQPARPRGRRRYARPTATHRGRRRAQHGVEPEVADAVADLDGPAHAETPTLQPTTCPPRRSRSSRSRATSRTERACPRLSRRARALDGARARAVFSSAR